MLFPSVNRQKTWLLLLLVVLVSSNLYFHFSFEGSVEERGRWIDRSIARVLTPIQTLFNFMGEWSTMSASKISRMMEAEQENVRLKEELTTLQLNLQNYKELESENSRLRNLLSLKAASKAELRAAKVVGRDVNIFFRTLEIDLGEEDGIERGMAVVCAQGAVGRILRVSASTSTVLLISDLNSRIDGVVQRSRSQVIVGGSPQGDLKLQLLARRSDVQSGDSIVTAGTGGLFPPGYAIGVIVGVAEDPNFVLDDASLEPTVDFGTLEEVFIVTKYSQDKKNASTN